MFSPLHYLSLVEYQNILAEAATAHAMRAAVFIRAVKSTVMIKNRIIFALIIVPAF